jgi:hypothetical protein
MMLNECIGLAAAGSTGMDCALRPTTAEQRPTWALHDEAGAAGNFSVCKQCRQSSVIVTHLNDKLMHL